MATHRSASIFDPMRKLNETKENEAMSQLEFQTQSCVLNLSRRLSYGGCMSFRSVLSSSAFGSLAQ